MRVFRHGDIVLREVEKLPDGVRKESIGFTQSGETGKLHVLPKVRVIEIDWRKFIDTLDGDVMTHPEHPPLELPPNTLLEVERVRSITPYLD